MSFFWPLTLLLICQLAKTSMTADVNVNQNAIDIKKGAPKPTPPPTTTTTTTTTTLPPTTTPPPPPPAKPGQKPGPGVPGIDIPNFPEPTIPPEVRKYITKGI